MDALHPITVAFAQTISTWVRSTSDAVLFGGPGMSWPLPPELLMGSSELEVFVLSDPDEHPVATGSLRLIEDGRVAHLGRVLVDPERRGQGWGRRLMLALLDQAWASADVQCVSLRVYSHNEPAATLYEQLGFLPSGNPRTTEVDEQSWTSVELRLPRLGSVADGGAAEVLA